MKIKVFGDPQKLKERQEREERIKKMKGKAWGELSSEERDDFLSYIFEINIERFKGE